MFGKKLFSIIPLGGGIEQYTQAHKCTETMSLYKITHLEFLRHRGLIHILGF